MFLELFVEHDFEHDALEEAVLGATLQTHIVELSRLEERNGKVVIRVQLARLSNQLRLAEASHDGTRCTHHDEAEHVVGCITTTAIIQGLEEISRVLKSIIKLIARHAHADHQVLTLGLPLALLGLFEYLQHVLLLLLFLRRLGSELLLQGPLFQAGLELILVLERVSTHFLLLLDGLLISQPGLLSHHLLVLELLLVLLPLELDLVLCLALAHLRFILDRLSSLFLLDLNRLDLALLGAILNFQMTRRFLHLRKVECLLRVG